MKVLRRSKRLLDVSQTKETDLPELEYNMEVSLEDDPDTVSSGMF